MTKVKICGITTAKDALYAAEHGADMLGFIFADVSKRYMAPENAKPIIEQVKSAYPNVLCIGVFVVTDGVTPYDIDEACAAAGADAAQLVGHLTQPFLRNLQTKYYASIRPASDAQAQQDKQFEHVTQHPGLPTLHLDAFHPDLWGGTGETPPITIAHTLAKQTPRLMLSGGLTPKNVADFVRNVQPWAVDVASGTEQAPGKKDHDKVTQFIQQAKSIVTES